MTKQSTQGPVFSGRFRHRPKEEALALLSAWSIDSGVRHCNRNRGNCRCDEAHILHAIQHPEKVPQRITDRMRRKLDLPRIRQRRSKRFSPSVRRRSWPCSGRFSLKSARSLKKQRKTLQPYLKPDQAKKWRERFDRLRIWFPALPAFHSIPVQATRE